MEKHDKSMKKVKDIKIPTEKVELLVHSDERILVKEYIQGIAVGFLLGFLVAWLWLM